MANVKVTSTMQTERAKPRGRVKRCTHCGREVPVVVEGVTVSTNHEAGGATICVDCLAGTRENRSRAAVFSEARQDSKLATRNVLWSIEAAGKLPDDTNAAARYLIESGAVHMHSALPYSRIAYPVRGNAHGVKDIVSGLYKAVRLNGGASIRVNLDPLNASQEQLVEAVRRLNEHGAPGKWSTKENLVRCDIVPHADSNELARAIMFALDGVPAALKTKTKTLERRIAEHESYTAAYDAEYRNKQ